MKRYSGTYWNSFAVKSFTKYKPQFKKKGGANGEESV